MFGQSRGCKTENPERWPSKSFLRRPKKTRNAAEMALVKGTAPRAMAPQWQRSSTNASPTRFGAAPRPRPAAASRLPRLRAGSDDAQLDLANLPDPDDARGAIAIGLRLTDAKQWEAAQQLFERALELPGTGLKRFRDKPRLLSDGEKIAALVSSWAPPPPPRWPKPKPKHSPPPHPPNSRVQYNIACCQAAMGEPDNIQNGLIAIAGCLEAGK